MLPQPLPAGSVLQGVVLASPRAPPTVRDPEVERMAAAQLTHAAREAFSALSELPAMRRTEDSLDGSLSAAGPGVHACMLLCGLHQWDADVGRDHCGALWSY